MNTQEIIFEFGNWTFSKIEERTNTGGFKSYLKIDNGDNVVDYPIGYTHKQKVVYDYPESIPDFFILVGAEA